MRDRANPLDIDNGPDKRAFIVAACAILWYLLR